MLNDDDRQAFIVFIVVTCTSLLGALIIWLVRDSQ
jgi:hypothetical protein